MAISTEERAQTFRRLHGGAEILLLPNAWDAGSARLIETLGAKAIATTSAGVAWSHGCADGHRLPVPLLVATATAIARVVSVPVSVDIEGGYSNQPAAVGELVARIVDGGGIGINLEDGEEPPDILCAKIEHAKRAGIRAGCDLFVNARTDVYWRNLAAGEAAVNETIARGRRYREAGCDGLFVPALVAPAAIRTIVGSTPLPLNVLAWPGLPERGELEALGVRRISAGAGIALTALRAARTFAAGFLTDGRPPAAAEGALTARELNALFSGA